MRMNKESGVSPDLGKRIAEWVAEHRSRIHRLAADMVGIPSVNEGLTGNEAAFQERACEWLAGLGMEVDRFTPDEVEALRSHEAYFPGKSYANRPNVVGVLRGEGGGRSLLFSSHADTAVVAPGWSADPWLPRIENGRLYGLGAFDMKGGMAASVMAVRCLRELGVRLRGDVLIESVVDEEFGGANGTLACRLRGYAADAAIVPEPTNLTVCPASRGGALWQAAFHGTTGMSFSGETVVNPTFAAGRFLMFLEWYERERTKRSAPPKLYASRPELPVIVTRVRAGDPNVPICDSGPASCFIDVWIECHPGMTEESLAAEVLDMYRDWSEERFGGAPLLPELTGMIRFLPGSEFPAGHPLLHEVVRRAGETLGGEPEVAGAPFACDAFMFNLYSSTPALIFGPSGGNAHAPDEYVDLSSLEALTEIYAKTIVGWCGTAEADPKSE